MDKHVNRSLAEQEASAQFRLNLWIYIPQAPQCTWPAGVGEGVLGLTTQFFSLFDIQPSFALPAGAERSQWSLYSGSGLATRSSGLQKNSYSLWHMLRRSIISLFLILSRALSSPFSPVRSVFTGACKITWQEQLKALDRTNVPSVPQTLTIFFLFH